MIARESRPGERAAKDLADEARITSIIPPPGGAPRVSIRSVATVNVSGLDSAHDIAYRLWERTATLRPRASVRLVVGNVPPPVFLPDIRADLVYAIDTPRGDVADAWLDALHRAVAEGVLA